MAGRLLAAAPGEGPGWRPHLAGGRVAAVAAAGAWFRSGGVGGPGGYAPPPSERPGGAGPGPKQPRQARGERG